jgi:hypothetical protein
LGGEAGGKAIDDPGAARAAKGERGATVEVSEAGVSAGASGVDERANDARADLCEWARCGGWDFAEVDGGECGGGEVGDDLGAGDERVGADEIDASGAESDGGGGGGMGSAQVEVGETEMVVRLLIMLPWAK